MIRRDHLLHLETCALVCVFFAHLVPWWAAALIALGIGIGKELYDKTGAGVASWKDIMYDAVGVLLGVIIAVL